MVKSNLVGIVKNTLRSAALVGVMALTLNSCKKHDITPPVQSYPPGVALDVSATSGDSPLSVHMKVSSMDKDIVSYRLYLDGVVDSSSSPIDTVMTFYPSTHTVYGEAVNAKRLSSKTSTTSINITPVDDDLWWTLYSLPKGKVNLFVYPDSTAEFNTKKIKKARDDYLEMVRASDITPTIPTGPHTVGGKDYGFACVQASQLFSINCIDFGKNLYVGGLKFYDWYNGDTFDSMYVHHGTLKYMGSHKVPIFIVDVSPSHDQNYAVTGNDLRNGKSLNLIEMMYLVSKTNLQPGQEGVPLDYPGFTLYYSYTFYKDGHNSYANIPVVKYNLSGGVLNFVSTNPNVDVIMTRDTLPIGINVNSPVDGKTYSVNNKIMLDEIITSGTNQISNESFRYAYYSFDGGATKVAMGPNDKKDLIYNNNRYFKPGNYTLSLYAKNEFYSDTNKNINFTVK